MVSKLSLKTHNIHKHTGFRMLAAFINLVYNVKRNQFLYLHIITKIVKSDTLSLSLTIKK